MITVIAFCIGATKSRPIKSYYDFIMETACIVNGKQLQADLYREGVMINVVDGSSTHEIKTHDRIIEVSVSECSSKVGAIGISNYDGFFYGCLLAVVQVEFQFQEMVSL